MVVQPARGQIDSLSLSDLREFMSGSLPRRNAERFSNLTSRTSLELVSALADFAHLGQATHNVNAVKLRKQLCLLSGTEKDENIVDFQPELAIVQMGDGYFTDRQVIFLKPIKPSVKKDDEFDIQVPVAIFEYNDEITFIKPSVSDQKRLVTISIRKTDFNEKNAQEKLIDFMSLTDENNSPFGTILGARFVSEKEYGNTAYNAVKEKMKSL